MVSVNTICHKIHIVGNRIAESSTYFFVIILIFIFRSFTENKNFRKRFLALIYPPAWAKSYPPAWVLSFLNLRKFMKNYWISKGSKILYQQFVLKLQNLRDNFLENVHVSCGLKGLLVKYWDKVVLSRLEVWVETCPKWDTSESDQSRIRDPSNSTRNSTPKS